MSEIMRYDCYDISGSQQCDAFPDPSGDYVLHSAHLAAIAAKDAEIAGLKQERDSITRGAMLRIAELEKALREAMLCDACEGSGVMACPPLCNCYGDDICTHDETEEECPGCDGSKMRNVPLARAALEPR